MEDIAISIAAKVVEYLVAPIVQPIARPFSYIWNYKTNFDNLKTEVRKLEGQKETVRISVDLARRNGDQIKQHVSDWLVCVETITDEASEVIEQNERANMKCFKGLCPNPKKRYQHSRNAAKKAKAIVDLYAEGNFETVSFRTIPEEIWIPSHIGYEAFESRMSTLKKILDALSNPDVNMVGIYGAGGIGKTTLAREIAKHAEDKNLFDVVAFAMVAVKPDIKEIQQEIADKLGLTFHEGSVSGRARRLQARLKQEEKVLLVLDNIWERLNLEDVGIPFGNDHKGCKLLLTARSRDVLIEMDCHHHFIFQIDVLDKGEAWSLFKKRACIENNDCLQALARKVAEACGGFPIAIISVAMALKNKEEFEWEDALEKLTTSSESNFEGVTGKTYSSIEISYTQLKEKHLKSTFLLCCQMEYTGLEALLEYGMGLGIFGDVNTMEKARNRVNTLVRELNDSSLLLDINNSRFSLHDVVRYVGRSIASEEEHKFMVAKNNIPRQWVDEDILKNCVGISLYNISKLPEEFECPKLQFFCMSTVRDLWRVPDNFFAGMPKLKVLHLAGLKLHSVPNSIHHLVNLRTLYIYDCKLRDVDFIGEFKRLEILRIRGCYGFEIEMIPKKMCNLTGLRLLDLKDCSILRNIPLNVLSTFTQLEELYLSSSIKWEVEGVNIPSYKGYMDFESRTSTLKNILVALSDPDVKMVGIYGFGGIGKTMLAREIAGQAEDKKLFNVVAFAEVAEKPDIKEIQQEIADKLGLTFREESIPGRARSLQQRLKQEEKVLLVLDNIWERLNLEDVGIPFSNDHKGCKLLLTARSLDVLSNKMDSQSNFKVDFLDKGEAWSLFEKKAGALDHLQALSKNVAEACGGLPIAIDSVAVALKTKEEFEWKDALRKLTMPSASNFEGVAAETYSSIEISYSQLKERELKSTFLLCCIMGYHTNVEDLLAYGMGMGIFKYVEAMEDARNRVHTLVRKLKDSSLLLDINNGTFTLHDVVRDVGRSIACRDGPMFTVTNKCIPREWVDNNILKNCVGISLYNISKLPEEFKCPELQFFYMSTARDLWRVPDNFFAGMPKLKVLHLAGLKLNSVPNSIRLLVNIRTLYIDDCQPKDIDFIGDLKQLEILRIRGYYCSFAIVPILKKMCNLTWLRLLDLSDCSIGIIPPNVLSTFTRLEELYLPSSIEFEVEGVNILDELKHLKHLTALKISIPDDSVLPKGRLVSNKLERYNITIGNCQWGCFDHGQTSRMVQLNLETSSCCDDVQKFFSLLDREGFPELQYLHVENSPCFRTVDCLESESCHHLLFLQSLSLHSVLNLEMIHNYPLKAYSFQQLRTIKVQFCHKLKNILSFSTYIALPLLQEVDVSSCDNMEEIFAIRREEVISNDEGMNQIEFKCLRTLKLHSLPKLTSFCSFNNNKDMFDTPTLLFNQKTFPSLEEIKISKSNNSKILRSLFAI